MIEGYSVKLSDDVRRGGISAYVSLEVEPRKAVRTARAWACWQLARVVLPDYPADELQIEREGVVEPTQEQIEGWLSELGLPSELEIWRRALAMAMAS